MLTLSLAPQTGALPSLPNMPGWLARLLAARGIATAEEAEQFLHPSRNQLRKPEALHDLDKAAELIRNAAGQGKRMVIYGDYDADGVSASAILYETLLLLGTKAAVYLPDRHREGYGLNVPAVEKLAGEADLLITVDCGITSIQEVRRAKELGMAVIVTDHHRHLEELPPADAVISPLLGDYPFPGLCGAGVAWKLALALAGEQAMELMELALKRCDLPVLLSLGQLHRGILLPFQLLIEFPIPDLLLDRGIAVFVDRKHLAALGAFDLFHVDISLPADSSGSRCVFLDADEIQDLRRSHSLLFIRRQACCPISRLNAVIAELRMVAAFDHQFQ